MPGARQGGLGNLQGGIIDLQVLQSQDFSSIQKCVQGTPKGGVRFD